jgi:hypothetical protein
MSLWQGQPSSRLGRSIVTQVATAQTNATQFTTPFAAQTYQVRVCSTLGIWATIGSTAVVTANSAATYIPAKRARIFCGDQWSGVELHQHIHIDRIRYVHRDDLKLGRARLFQTGRALTWPRDGAAIPSDIVAGSFHLISLFASSINRRPWAGLACHQSSCGAVYSVILSVILAV